MKTVLLLCGNNESGKTNTLKHFFGVSDIAKLKPMQVLQKVVNGQRVLSVNLSSPQEQEDFCSVEDVEKNINNRLQKCEEICQGKDYILVIPFGIYQKSPTERELNEKCLLKPVEWLKTLGFKVIGVYLRKDNARLLDQKDNILRKITNFEILSNEEYSRQAKELEEIILKFI